MFHVSTRSLYIYGGMLYKVDKVVPSNELYALHFPSRRWSLLTVDRDSNPPELAMPRARYLHAAVTTEDYMLIIGGQTEPTNSSDTLMAYSYACNTWINLAQQKNNAIELIGSPLAPAVGLAATRHPASGSVYIMGGMWAGAAQGTLIKLEVPDDLCALWSNSKLKCKATPGCSYCAVYEPSGSNATFCYSSSKMSPERCTQPQGVLEFSKGAACGPERVASRDCYQHASCSECLGEWPIYRGLPQSCQVIFICKFLQFNSFFCLQLNCNFASGVPTVNRDVVYLMGPTAKKKIVAKSNSVIRSMPLNATNDLAQLLIAINAKI